MIFHKPHDLRGEEIEEKEAEGCDDVRRKPKRAPGGQGHQDFGQSFLFKDGKLPDYCGGTPGFYPRYNPFLFKQPYLLKIIERISDDFCWSTFLQTGAKFCKKYPQVLKTDFKMKNFLLFLVTAQSKMELPKVCRRRVQKIKNKFENLDYNYCENF